VVDAIGYLDCLYGVMLNTPRPEDEETDEEGDDDDGD
jgi:hypothetical protein